MSGSDKVWDISERDFPESAAIEAKLGFLLRFAILAPSPRNSQPWRFAVRGNKVFLMADLARSQPVCDPDRRELYISLGCALENLLVAAEHFGFAHSVNFFPHGRQDDLAATVLFREGGAVSPARAGTTLDAIRCRHNDVSLFRATPISTELRRRLTACCVEPDLAVGLSDDKRFRRWIDWLTVQSDRTDLANPAFRIELEYWRTREVFGAGLGSPPRALTVEAATALNHWKVESAPLLGLIRGVDDSHFVHLRSGQLFERVWLTATALGISINPMSQTMRHPELRSTVAELVPAGWVPQHLFRVGYSRGQPEPHTARRPLAEVLL